MGFKNRPRGQLVFANLSIQICRYRGIEEVRLPLVARKGSPPNSESRRPYLSLEVVSGVGVPHPEGVYRISVVISVQIM